MGGHQGSHGLPALWGEASRLQQRNCRPRHYTAEGLFTSHFLADENWTEDPREENVRSSHETNLLRPVCCRRGKHL